MTPDIPLAGGAGVGASTGVASGAVAWLAGGAPHPISVSAASAAWIREAMPLGLGCGMIGCPPRGARDMRCAMRFVSLALALALAACGGGGDECDRAAARLRRLDDAHHREHPGWMDGEIRTQCREHGWDPVANCVIVGPTDEAAEACIERGMAGVIGPGSGAITPGKGLNPLLDDHW
jgi:hypothetical protein